ARPLAAALARIVRARAVNPRFIEGQMRHGPRGAAELAETVDRLVGFAQTTDAVPSALFDLLHEAYVADPRVRAFLLRENPAATATASSRSRRAAASKCAGSLLHQRRLSPTRRSCSTSRRTTACRFSAIRSLASIPARRSMPACSLRHCAGTLPSPAHRLCLG